MGRVAYHLLEVREFLSRGDVDRLDEELVAALRILRGVRLHGLEEYCTQGTKSGGQSHVTTSMLGEGKEGLLPATSTS